MKSTPFSGVKKPVFITNYFPSIKYFFHAIHFQEIYLEAKENYQKHSFRNRCAICTVNGKNLLSVPLEKGKNLQCPIKEVRIAYHSDWTRQHLKTMRTAYGNAPFFHHYIDELETIWSYQFKFLFDLNRQIMESLFKILGLDMVIRETTTYEKESPPEFIDFRDLRNLRHPSTADFALFSYEQVFSDRLPFVPNLSILDLILCKGPETVSFLNQLAQKTAIRP